MKISFYGNFSSDTSILSKSLGRSFLIHSYANYTTSATVHYVNLK